MALVLIDRDYRTIIDLLTKEEVCLRTRLANVTQGSDKYHEINCALIDTETARAKITDQYFESKVH